MSNFGQSIASGVRAVCKGLANIDVKRLKTHDS